MNNKKINKVAFIAIFSFIILNIYIGIKLYEKKEITDNIIRLHVVANSNDTKDQIEKLKVHSKIQEYINNLNIKEENILDYLKNNSNDILNIVNSTLSNDNINYDSYIKIGKINYEEKQSVTEDMPTGSYNSMQIILGKGEGKNIWSFIFPNEENIKKLENYNTILPNLSNIYEDNNYTKENVEIEFKAVEIFNTIKEKVNEII